MSLWLVNGGENGKSDTITIASCFCLSGNGFSQLSSSVLPGESDLPRVVMR